MSLTAGGRAGIAANLRQDERRFYDAVFESLDVKKDGFVAPSAVAGLLRTSDLTQATLAKIWEFSNSNTSPGLTLVDFYCALRAVAACQAGHELAACDRRDLPLPVVKVPHLGLSTETANSGGPVKAAHNPLSWTLTKGDVARYAVFFDSADENKDGFLSGQEAVRFFKRSKLPKLVLTKLWTLSDVGGDGKLNLPEFCLALHLTRAVKQHGPDALPNVLPDELVDSLAKLSTSLPALEAHVGSVATLTPMQPTQTPTAASASGSVASTTTPDVPLEIVPGFEPPLQRQAVRPSPEAKSSPASLLRLSSSASHTHTGEVDGTQPIADTVELRSSLLQQRVQRDALRADTDALRAQSDIDHSEVERHGLQFRQLSEEILSLQKEKAELEHETSSRAVELEQLRSRAHDFRCESGALRDEISALRDKLAEIAQDKDDYDELVKAKSDLVRDEAGILDALRGEVRRKQNTLDALQGRAANASVSLESLQEKKSTLEAEILSLDAQREEALVATQELEAKRDVLSASCVDAEERLHSARILWETDQEEHETLIAEVEALRQRENHLVSELQVYLKRQKELNKSIQLSQSRKSARAQGVQLMNDKLVNKRLEIAQASRFSHPGGVAAGTNPFGAVDDDGGWDRPESIDSGIGHATSDPVVGTDRGTGSVVDDPFAGGDEWATSSRPQSPPLPSSRDPFDAPHSESPWDPDKMDFHDAAFEFADPGSASRAGSDGSRRGPTPSATGSTRVPDDLARDFSSKHTDSDAADVSDSRSGAGSLSDHTADAAPVVPMGDRAPAEIEPSARRSSSDFGEFDEAFDRSDTQHLSGSTAPSGEQRVRAAPPKVDEGVTPGGAVDDDDAEWDAFDDASGW